jgi:hypothetical protein
MRIRVSDDSAAEQMDCRQGHGRACWLALSQQASVAVFEVTHREQHSRDPACIIRRLLHATGRTQTIHKTKKQKPVEWVIPWRAAVVPSVHAMLMLCCSTSAIVRRHTFVVETRRTQRRIRCRGIHCGAFWFLDSNNPGMTAKQESVTLRIWQMNG